MGRYDKLETANDVSREFEDKLANERWYLMNADTCSPKATSVDKYPNVCCFLYSNPKACEERVESLMS